MNSIADGETLAVYKSNIFELVRHLSKYDRPKENDLQDIEEHQIRMDDGMRMLR